MRRIWAPVGQPPDLGAGRPAAGCAPELHPVEGLWASLKGNQLANVACAGGRVG